MNADSVDKVNPAKFDKADDMAELTHLNEASVVHNLHMRYQADLIYTYSGLFLVTINPYCPLPIYTNEYINMYKGQSREETKPHIYAMADEAFRNLVDEGQNQSILVTGESGAGKTENTKKVIQYLAAVAHSDFPVKKGSQQHSSLSQQILRANPILEAFGNAQTVRNNNSSRFGKFIRIEFTRTGTIAGAFIDWYLLEKSRVVRLNSHERNYHVFYQLLKGADRRLKEEFLLSEQDVEDFAYTRGGHDTISGVSDRDEWNFLIEAFNIMGFSDQEQVSILRTVAAVLHLGNITVVKESRAADQARLAPDARSHAEKVCKLLGLPIEPFLQGLLHPKVKAGREWVEKVQTPEQVRLGIDALAKGIYERGFGDLVSRINRQLDRTGMGLDDSRFIGVLDIAGFEIFEENSFEQLCINYTNEKLQQFFNHHMFVLEQEEYAREQIEWKFIDFGLDLQPTIDLIELPNPIGIFSCLDEDSVMPKATDKSFTEKLHSLWERKTPKYRPSRLGQGFLLTHYAAEVEYSTEGWLEKNKDPLNDNVTRLLAASIDKHVANLFVDCSEADDDAGTGAARSRVKKGLFRTVAQRHKEQLSSLMTQLHSTHPHFVRCIIPNHKKRPKQLSAPLVLDQLRCNGVLEGIRISRTGFPNRLPFSEFRQRYEVLCRNMPRGYVEGQSAASIMLEKLGLDKSLFRVGLTKVFFRAGVLAELEEQRDALIREIMSRFQSLARGFTQRRIANKRLYRAEATRIVQRNFQVYLDLCENPWWRLLTKMKPLLGATRTSGEVKKRDEMIKKLNDKMKQEATERQRLDEERRNAHTEMQRIQQTLESERALALDKEEIFKRLQLRETELSDKLAGALDDQEKLEDQLDDLLEAKKRVEQQSETYRTQLEQAGQIIAKLESEKRELSDKLTDLDAQFRELVQNHAQRSAQESKLTQEVQLLQSQLSMKDRKAQDLESKLLKFDQDLDVKLATATKDLQTSRLKESQLSNENRKIQQQLSELSATSTGYEDLVRRKESELAVLRSDNKKYEAERATFDNQKRALASEKENVASRLREVQAEMFAMKSQKANLEKEAAETKKLLDARLTEDAQAGQNRRMLESQILDLKEQLAQVQKDLSKERQSRDDVRLLAEHKFQELKEKFEEVNEAKIIIEKELYVQQDTLRRAVEAKKTAERERNDARNEIRKLREEKSAAEEARIEAERAGDRSASRLAREREASLMKDLEAELDRVRYFESECSRLNQQVEELNKVMVESGDFGLKVDQEKDRLQAQLDTVRSRLKASENDNKALLNKLQQKNLDIARSGSRASESSRGQLLALQREKAKIEEQNQKLNKQLGDAQLTVASLQKQKEKLELSLEDLNHEVAREHKTSRNAEKQSSTFTTQLAEASRKLEDERKLHSQVQAKNRQLQSIIDNRDQDILQLMKLVDPEMAHPMPQFDGGSPERSPTKSDNLISKLTRKVEELQQNLRVQSAGRSNAESQVLDLRRRFEEEFGEVPEWRSPSRPKLEEMNPNEAARQSPTHLRNKLNGRPRSNVSTPTRRFPSTGTEAQDSGRSDRTADILSFNNRMDLKADLEELQNQLQLTQMQNRHLQSQLERSTPARELWPDDSPSLRRVQKLEQANSRLHDMLDDSAKKVSALEKSIQTGELSLRDIQTKSHEELFELINNQEDNRRNLLHAHKDTLADLGVTKKNFESLKHTRATLEVELRDAKSDLEEMMHQRDQDAASRNQLLQEYTDIQIRLDAESSKLADVSSSLSLYKSRADEYFSKLEQAEIAVLKASRAEQFAKSQAKEAEETCAEIMSERKNLDATIEDLQRQNQSFEERIEDMSADLEAALQARKRLQHELEDYRNQRAMDIEDKEASMEQTRKKYQAEFATLTNELDIAREEKLFRQAENTRLREELDDLRSKWDDEVLNSSTWSKEKARLEVTLADISASRDEAIEAHNDAQSKVVSLLSQLRSTRTEADDVIAERDALVREKRNLEARLEEAKAGLDDLARGDSLSLRNAAGMDRELLELKSKLAEHEDIASAAVSKMRRVEAQAFETQKDYVAEREITAQLSQDKAALEKSLKEVQVRLVDLETKGYSSASQDVRFLTGRVQEVCAPNLSSNFH